MTIRLAANGKWFESIPSTEWLELDYERIIMAHSETLFEDFHVLQYKKIFRSPLGNKVPDLFMVAKDYSSWWVVEIELSHHSLGSHILPQMEIIISYSFNENDLEYICKKCPDIDIQKLSLLVNTESANYLVLVDKHKDSWQKNLTNLQVKIGILEIFKSEDGDVIIRANGVQPLPITMDIIASGLAMDDHANLYIRFPLRLPDTFRSDRANTLIFEGVASLWRRVDENNISWLISSVDFKNYVLGGKNYKRHVRIGRSPSGRKFLFLDK